MKVRQIEIKGFRGIKQLSWSLPDNSIICLIGPGDSTKTTILDAIEMALSPKWNLIIGDNDFYQSKTENPIEITVTVGNLPNNLLNEAKFGLHLRGWKNGELLDEPVSNDYESVLSVRLNVDKTLEPKWSVVTDRNPDGIVISAKDREHLGMVRLGSFIDRQLSWGRGSALARLTDDLENVTSVLADAHRIARGSVNEGNLPKLKEAADKARKSAIEFGVHPKNNFQPALDPVSANDSVSSLTLFDGDFPARQAGLGSRRLLALAIQQFSILDGAIQLIDEIEHGLEPHRLRHLVYLLKHRAQSQPVANKKSQVLLTTHSNIVIEELNADDLFVVRSHEGITTVSQIGNNLQATIRAESVALLGEKIIVCEGKTELGICRALDRVWMHEKTGKPFAHLGVVPVDGGGDSAPQRAIELTQLGYQVCFLGDSDVPINPSEEKLTAAGIKVIRWADNLATEQRVCLDLPWESLNQLLGIAIELKSKDAVTESIAAKLKCKSEFLQEGINVWESKGFSREQIRMAIGLAAKSDSQKWFKRIDTGELLGRLVSENLLEVAETDLGKKIGLLKQWCYE